MDPLIYEARRGALLRLVQLTSERYDDASVNDEQASTMTTKMRLAYAKDVFARATFALADLDKEKGDDD